MYIFADSIDVSVPDPNRLLEDRWLMQAGEEGCNQVVGNKAYVEAHAESETFKAGTYKNKSVP